MGEGLKKDLRVSRVGPGGSLNALFFLLIGVISQRLARDGPAAPGKRIEEASDYFIHGLLGSGGYSSIGRAQLLQLGHCDYGGEMPLEPRASWFSPKCIEAQQLTGHLGLKHYFSVVQESGTKSRKALNTRYGLKIKKEGSKSTSEMMGDKLHRQEGNSPDHQLRILNSRSVIKEVGVQRQPGGELSALEGSLCMNGGGRSGSENVGLSNANIGSSTEGASGPKIRPKGIVNGQQVKEVGDLMTGEPATEVPMNGSHNYNGPKVSKFLIGYILTRTKGLTIWHYLGERLDKIDMSMKMRTTYTWTKRPYKASLFLGIGFRYFLRSLGGIRRRPPSRGPEPSVRYHSGRARILTLCQDLRTKGQSQVDSFYGE
ncbi:hypothetical protein FXO38_10635 [Capsicum annuum]|nr:hypothetical protein FXO38_10635 [Capsicum annuum]KAF3685131.1 hypothetical protein FXO37_00926 [Capsicum annuum]